MLTRISALAVLALVAATSVFAQEPARHYAVFLQDEPAARRFSARAGLESAAGVRYRQGVESAQRAVRTELATRKIQITGSVSTLLNAVFVTAPASRVAEMKSIPGVVDVVALRRHAALLNRATTLMNAPAAWATTPGGMSNAGAGIKIGILDTGVDQTHPALQDSSLPMPAGFPKCSGSDCDFTSNKVIVARSYIRQLAAGSDASNPAADSRPDDFSPRDHVGHGTATASAVAGNTATGAVTINGMAPKAYIGNYRILGSPTVNDGTYDDIMVMALEDALNDGMDIVSMSVAGPAFAGPLDAGAVCGNAPGVPCDIAAQAFETAAQSGLTIVIAGGNSGSDGKRYPLYNSINSPATAPSVIAAGATTNSHSFTGLVEVTGAGVPGNLNAIASSASDSLASGGAVTGPLVDVTQLGNDGFACAALPAGSLNGAIALIERGGASCSFANKLGNAADAGALGVVFYMANAAAPINPSGLGSFAQTAVMISNADGLNLKTFADTHPGLSVTIDPSAVEVGGAAANQLASFSSAGPALGTNGIKPDLLAVGETLYMPAQNYDPLGEMFSANRFIFAAGTSFSTPLIAGAAALVKQNHPLYGGAQIKSALVNTATQDVTVDDQGFSVSFLQTGPGKMATDNAVKTNVTVSPATLSFGALTSGVLPLSRQLSISSSGDATLTLAVTPSSASGPVPALGVQTLPGGASGIVTVTLSGAIPAAGIYSGAVTISGGTVPLRVPYMYVVGSGVATNIQILSGDYDDGTVSQPIPDGQVAFQLTDSSGVPVAGTPVSFLADRGITLSKASTTTDVYGIAYATAALGPVAGTYSIYACAAANCTAQFVNNAGNSNRLGYQFTEYSRVAPAITAAGVVNAASYVQPIAPGSYVTIFGTGLYDPDLTATGHTSDISSSARLPLALDYTMVSFDVPGAVPPVSLPGRMYYVSANQISLQVPWELQGFTSAQVKVTIDATYGNVVTIPLANYSPALFPYGTFAASTNAAGVVNNTNPGVRGEVLTLYANGLGPVDNPQVSGDPAPISPLARTTTVPSITIGNQPAQVLFSGLSPGAVGLYQINVIIPTGIGAGIQPVSLSIGGQSSPALTIPVL